MGKIRRTLERGCPAEPSTRGVGVLCQSLAGLFFPSGPHPEERCGGERWPQPAGASFFSVLQALPTAEEVPASAAAPPAPRCCCLR